MARKPLGKFGWRVQDNSWLSAKACKQKEGQWDFKPALHSMVWCKFVSGLERDYKLTWVTQVFPHQLDLTRVLWGQLELCPSCLFQSSCSTGGDWPSVEEAAVIGQPTHWYFIFELKEGETLTATVLSPASQLCAKGSFSFVSHSEQNTRKTQVDSHEPSQWDEFALHLQLCWGRV